MVGGRGECSANDLPRKLVRLKQELSVNLSWRRKKVFILKQDEGGMPIASIILVTFDHSPRPLAVYHEPLA